MAKKLQKLTTFVKILSGFRVIILNFFNYYFHRFPVSKLSKKMVLAVFTRCLVSEIHILAIKSTILNTNERFSRKRDIFSKKRPCYDLAAISPQLHTKFQKNPRSGF